MQNFYSENSRILVAAVIYAAFIIAIALLGIMGNGDEQAIRTAHTHFSSETISAGRAYFAWGAVPSLFSRLAKLAVLVFFIHNHRSIISFLENRIPRKNIRLIIMVFLVIFSLHLISFPFAIISDYLRKKIFGLLTSGFSLWLFRYAVSIVVGLFITTLAGTLFIWVAARFRRYYVLFPSAILALSLAGVLLYPRAILPLTHSAQKLENGALESNITQMLKKAHAPVRAIYVLDESKYSKHVNAFFTGWGPYREIYLYDSILHNHTQEEALAIIAHELCHYREEHVVIGIIMGAFGLYLALLIMGKICLLLFNQTLVMAAREMKIAHLVLIFSMLMFIAQPVKNSVSRAMERRCDSYACELTGNRHVFAEMEKKIAIANRSDILPHPAHHFWFGTHPTAVERIKSALKER